MDMKPIVGVGLGPAPEMLASYAALNDTLPVSKSVLIAAMHTSWAIGSWSWTKLAVSFLLVWPRIVAGLRYRRSQTRKKRFNFPTRESFAKMTVEDAQAIQLSLLESEVPILFLTSIKLAVFAVNGIPSISGLLVKTNKLPSQRVHHRFSMTSAMIAEFLAAPPSHERSKDAISRMNNIHQTYQRAGKISNDDMLYTLGLFVYLPIRWVEKYDWRELNDMEKCALGTFWKNIGDSMEIDYSQLPSSKIGWKDGLHFVKELTQWGDNYEATHMVPHINNQRVGMAALDIMLWTTPNFLKPFFSNVVFSLLDDRMLDALLLPKPHKLYGIITKAILYARKRFVRYFMPPRPHFLRFKPLYGPDKNGRFYLQTYESKPYYVKPTFWNLWLAPGAIVRRILNLPLPGSNREEFHSNGYQMKELGPAWIVNKKGHEDDVRAARERMNKTYISSGCPFA